MNKLAQGGVNQLNPATDCQNLGINCANAANATGKTLYDSIWYLVNIGLGFVSIVAVIILIYAGVKYILARGDDKEIEKAKTTILYTVIGLIIIGFAGAIVNFIIIGR